MVRVLELEQENERLKTIIDSIAVLASARDSGPGDVGAVEA